MFGILDGVDHYSIGHGVLDELVESPTMSDLENDDPDPCYDASPSHTESFSLPASLASDNGSSSTQMAQPPATIPNPLPVPRSADDIVSTSGSVQESSDTTPTSVSRQHRPSNLSSGSGEATVADLAGHNIIEPQPAQELGMGLNTNLERSSAQSLSEHHTDSLLSPDSSSRAISAQALLDLSSNSRPSFLPLQPHPELDPVLEQQSLPLATSSSNHHFPYEEVENREEAVAPVSEETFAHMRDVRVALTDIESRTFTVAQRNFFLDSFVRYSEDFSESMARADGHGKFEMMETKGNLDRQDHPDSTNDKDGTHTKLEKEIIVRGEDSMVVTDAVELEKSTTVGESPPTQPMITEPLHIDLQKQHKIKDMVIEWPNTDSGESSVMVVEDDPTTIKGAGPDFSTTRGKYPSIRPIVLNRTVDYSQKQIKMKDSEADSYGMDDSEPIASLQDTIASTSDIEDEASITTKPIATGPAAISTQNSSQAQYLDSSLRSMEVDDNPIASTHDDTTSSATTEDLGPDASSPEAETAQYSPPGQSTPAAEEEEEEEEAEGPDALSQAPADTADVPMSDETSQAPELAPPTSPWSSMLESVTMIDDVSDQMAIGYAGGGITHAVDIVVRTAAVGAWCEVLDGDGDGERREGNEGGWSG